MPSYYEVLGVPPDADDARIRSAYVAAVQASPTSRSTPSPRDRKLDEAYAVLGHEDRRRRYDELRESAQAGNPELVALLSVIADTGGIPSAVDVLGPPPARPQPVQPRPPPAPWVPGPTPPPPRPAPADPRRTDLMGGMDGSRETFARRRTVLGLLLLAAGVGAVTGMALAGPTQPAATFEPGACIAIGEEEAIAVVCTDPRANATIIELTDDPVDCADAPLAHLELGDGRYACVGQLETSTAGG
jgi:hypothetical protein